MKMCVFLSLSKETGWEYRCDLGSLKRLKEQDYILVETLLVKSSA
jgi:hypothetical protein